MSEILGGFQVVLPADSGITVKFAADELKRYIGEITDTEVLAGSSPSAGCRSIELVLSATPDPAVVHDGFRWEKTAEGFRISANIPRGILNGVYALLEHWGCRWFFYRDQAVIPRLKNLTFPESRVVNPDLELRGVCIFSVMPSNVEEIRIILDWLGKNRFNLLMTSVSRTEKRDGAWKVEWGKVQDQLLPELLKRDMLLNISEHSGRYFFPVSYFKEHPEWFAMNAEGKRFATGQICYSNPEAIQVLKKNYAAYAAAHPEVDILGTWPEDGYGFCQCSECRKPGAVLKAINQVADEIYKVRPDLTVEYLSYTSETSDVPPEILPRKNMAILVANMRVAREWKKKTEAVGGLGVYSLNYHITDNTAARANLALNFADTLTTCRQLKEEGIRGIIPFFIGTDTWWRSSLNLYFLTRFAWDNSLEVDEVLEDFCNRWFPSAPAVAMKLFQGLQKMPFVNQGRPPRWPLWQHWDTLKTEYRGAKWLENENIFKDLLSQCDDLEKQSAEDPARLQPVRMFVIFQYKMFLAWHYRALAVEAFERQDKDSVREFLKKTAAYEQELSDWVNNPETGFGIAGARCDYEFFLNWRLQLDKQLLEMRTDENMIPVTDMNGDVEQFLPAMLGN